MFSANEEIQIDLNDGIQKVIEELTQLARNNKYVFRGYGKQDELLPNIIRERISYIDAENDLLCDFEKYGSHYFHANTPIDFMSYAQHFGLPTRLLDFTYNPFIALAFALYTPKSSGKYKYNDDRDYYYIRYASISSNIVLHTIPLSEDIYNMKYTRSDSLAVRACQSIDYIQDLFGKNYLKQNGSVICRANNIHDIVSFQEKVRERAILFIDPNQSNQRIIMQQGLFMLPYTLSKDDHLDIIKRNSSVIKIHKDMRVELLQYLDTLGYNSFRLMPDLASICYTVKRKVIDERSEKSDHFKKKTEDN